MGCSIWLDAPRDARALLDGRALPRPFRRTLELRRLALSLLPLPSFLSCPRTYHYETLFNILIF